VCDLTGLLQRGRAEEVTGRHEEEGEERKREGGDGGGTVTPVVKSCMRTLGLYTADLLYMYVHE